MRYILNYIRRFYPFFLFLLLSLFIISNWFKAGLIYGGGDVGLQTYNPQRTFENAKYIWWEAIAPGTPIPQGLTALPFHFIFSKLQLLGFSAVNIQFTLFFLILFSMGFGMYRLLLTVFDKGKNYPILGGLFYMFNPYMMVQVWHRFVHSTFFLVAALPFLALFWIKWVRGEGHKWLLFFLITNLVSLYMYGTIAYILTIWILLFLISLFDILLPFDTKKLIKVGARFFLGFIFWFLTNIWWIIPVFSVAPAVFSQQHNNEESIFTLINIGRQSIIPYSLQFVNPFYLFWQAELGEIYKNPLIRLIQYLSVSTILVGIIYCLKDKKTAMWSLIFLIIFFLSKGAAEPLSYPYILGLKNLFFLGVLRNPFEKIGVLLPFVGSILFVSGFIFFKRFLSKYLKSLYINSILIFVVVVIFSFNLPMIVGQPFGKPNNPGYVEVSQSYKSADNWINSDADRASPARILHLPLATGESISYRWKYGYNGLEPSDLLFTSLPSISHGFNIKSIDSSLEMLSTVIKNKDKERILQALEDFNVKYIVLHKDVNWTGTDLPDPLFLETILDELPYLDKAQSFNDLIIYKIQDQYFKQRVSLESSMDIIFPRQNITNWAWLIKDNTVISPQDNEAGEEVIGLSSKLSILPNKIFNFTLVNQEILKSITNNSIAPSQLNESLNNPIKRVEQILIQNGELGAKELSEKIMESNNLISRIYQSPDNRLIEDYKKLINKIFASDFPNSRLFLYLNTPEISQIFQVHLYILSIKGAETDWFKDKLVQNDMVPMNLFNIQDQINERTYFKTEIPKTGNYELLLISNDQKFQDTLSEVNFSFPEGTRNIKGSNKGDFMYFSTLSLEKGRLEIGIPILTSINLFKKFDGLTKIGSIEQLDSSTMRLSSVDQPTFIESQLMDAGGSSYRISFQAKAEKGEGFYFQQVQDTDKENLDGQKEHQINQFIALTSTNDWQTFNFTLPKMRRSTSVGSIRFAVLKSTALIKDVKLEKIYDGSILLKNERLGSNDKAANQRIVFSHPNPGLYRGKINVHSPTFLTFRESFHPGWKLKLTQNKESFYPAKHFIGDLYGNAWLLEKSGEFDFSLEFEPQKIVNSGMIITMLSYLFLFILLFTNKFLKR